MDLQELVLGLEDPQTRPPDILAGIEDNGDAAVLRLTDDLAIVQSVDFISPVSNDPYRYGAIAAANALSDLYAVGATPRTALNICLFPDEIDPLALRQILRGALEKVNEAGATLVGGHTVRGKELQFGLSVTGTIDPAHVIRNAGARVGDHLVITKPLGTGVYVSAFRSGLINESDLSPALDWMLTLNRRPSELMANLGAHSCTDISGFGLAYHALEMAKGSNVALRIMAHQVPVLPRALQLIACGTKTSLTEQNRAATEHAIIVSSEALADQAAIFFDPQTSGGLLIALAPDDALGLVAMLNAEALHAYIIGEVVPAVGNTTLEVVS